MSKTLFILGAGASKQAGGPLMCDFLDVADAIRNETEIGPDRASFELVFRAFSELDVLHAKAAVDIRNFESVLGLFDAARILGKLGSLSSVDVERLGSAIRRVIVRTLERRIRYPIRNQAVLAPPPYGDFITLVDRMSEAGLGPISFITFNYDMALDYALHRQGKDADYCLDPKPTGGTEIMKLHGSLNWARCASCRKVIPWPLRQYFQKYNWDRAILGDFRYGTFEIGSHLQTFQHCNLPCEPEPVIIPPTWNKPQYRVDLEAVWRRAAESFADAENIFVVGFSLPPTDEFFRFLYAVGAVGPARIKQFWVIDPAQEVRQRFKSLLGPPIQDRFKDMGSNGFDEAIREIASTLLGTSIDREVA